MHLPHSMDMRAHTHTHQRMQFTHAHSRCGQYVCKIVRAHYLRLARPLIRKLPSYITAVLDCQTWSNYWLSLQLPSVILTLEDLLSVSMPDYPELITELTLKTVHFVAIW